jgi:hypothetical protein
VATPRDRVQSILTALALAQNVDDDLLATPGVPEILEEMDILASELAEVLE